MAISMVDLTTLEGADTPGKVAALAAKARRPDPTDPPPAGRRRLRLPRHGRRPSSTACGGAASSRQRRHRLPVRTGLARSSSPTPRDAVAAGADEIDMVIDRGAFLAGRYHTVFDEIVAVKEACGPAHLKVILETGELATYDNVRRASWLAMLAGADFIKTSHRQGVAGGDAAGHPGDARGGARLPPRDRASGRRQARRRHPYGQGRHQVPRHGQRDLRRRLARPPTCSASARPACSTTC